MNKETVQMCFCQCGLLVRTVQLKSLGNNFRDIDDSITEALEKKQNNSNYYGPKRRWSIAHLDIKPDFYKMEEANTVFSRHLAIMVVPSLVDWKKYIAISTQDESSNSSITPADKLLGEKEAKNLYCTVLKNIKEKTSTEQNQNSEVSTCGFNINAFCGLLFKGTEEWWQNNLEEIKRQLAVLKAHSINDIDVYTYDNGDNGGTVLSYKQKIEL